MGVLVEICCGSVEDVLESAKGGAHRVELCSALSLGGLTPSAATISEAKRLTKLPLMVMIRPRGGGFCYSEAEIDTMEREIDLAGELGADGFVFGVLSESGIVDTARTGRLVKRCQGQPTVFHRAFDVTPEPFEALEAVIDLGCTRLLTSGQKQNSLEGAPLIQELMDRSMGQIEILPGGGVRVHNMAEIIRSTGCTQVHMTAHAGHFDTSTYANRSITFGSNSAPSEDRVDVVDYSVVAAILMEADQL
jgi:copper homeostasis protein